MLFLDLANYCKRIGWTLDEVIKAGWDMGQGGLVFTDPTPSAARSSTGKARFLPPDVPKFTCNMLGGIVKYQ